MLVATGKGRGTGRQHLMVLRRRWMPWGCAYNLQAGRAFAALPWLHIVQISHRETSTLLRSALNFGWLGVDFRFVLSGFILCEARREKPL